MRPLLETFRASLLALCVPSLAFADGAHTDAGDATPPARIEYSTEQIISAEDSEAVMAEKAAKVLPRPNQAAWMRLERTFFIHFGPNTFRGVEWGTGREEPADFNPTAFDANQWVSAVKDAGGKMLILVCKHHDGFCLWPTRYTQHSVATSPWQNGKGDEVMAVADAARAQGIRLGVYLSPADLYQLRTNPKNPGGYFGNGSYAVPSVIPTDPASFKDDPSKGRMPPAGYESYDYTVDDYNRYFLNQLYELLTEHGTVSTVWFDGANPDPSVRQDYDFKLWYDLVRRLQPDAVISVKGPDVRWVGNEAGVGRTTEWSVIPLPESPETFTWPDMSQKDLGSREKLKPGSHLWWYPAEVNTSILSGWFWGRNKRPKSVPNLIDVYYNSVGRNGNMLLNLAPDKRGLIPGDQLAPLSQMAQVVNDTFAKNLAAGGTLTADSANLANEPSRALDGDPDTWWEAAPGRTDATLTLTLPAETTFDVMSLQEAVDHRGQRIENFVVETWNGSAWDTADQQTTVGHKRLLRLKSPITTSRVRIRITGSRLEPTLAEVGLFRQAVLAPPPVFSERDVKGAVTLGDPDGNKMVYTADGTTPTIDSEVYEAPIPLLMGGVVQAACLTSDGRLGMIASKYYAGMTPIGWKVVEVDSEERDQPGLTAANATDGNSATFWQTRVNADEKLPHHITVDLGHAQHISGFTYLPRQDRKPDGVVENYRFETSEDGKTWMTNVDSGRFGNIRNNPVLQEVSFSPVTARYFRFTALKSINRDDASTTAAEISVVLASDPNPSNQ